MNNDFMRTALFLKLQCSECGELIKMSYDEPKNKTDGWTEDEPTGAALVRSLATVHPCDCTLKYKEDFNKLKDLLK